MPFLRRGLLLVLILLVLLPTPVFALTAEECAAQTIGTIACLPVYFNNIANGAFALAGIAAVFFITFSGIRFLLSGGDPIKVEKAKKSMTMAIIGFVIVLLSFTAIKSISLITGAECINTTIFNNCN